MWRYEVRSCRRWALHLEHCTAPGQDRHRGGRAGRVLGAAQFRSNPYGENISSSSRMFWPAAAAALSLALSGQYHHQHRIPQVVTNTDTRRQVPSGYKDSRIQSGAFCLMMPCIELSIVSISICTLGKIE